ncbi:hypothetical protein AWZ03_010932 [Drosophila navojoa]|uniref:Protein kinase domain-containing protein n=1 Tax=Drosophila navojoa TaxID=7232 RepID=A0A484B1H6_DRONA|nr:hypothetical protein AWZ03_010932 [Drosophila navojoa]
MTLIVISLKLPAKVLYDTEQMESNVIPSCNSIISKGSVFPVMALTGRQLVRTTITVKELIGNGTFGRVYKAHLDNSEHLVALKQVDFDPNKMHIEARIMIYLKV